MKQATGCFNGAALFLMVFLDSHVNAALPYF